MSNTMLYVDFRLNQWAEWFSSENLHGLGFPSQSIEYRLMTEGVLINSTAPRQFLSNEDAEEIEALVKELARINEKVSLALRSQYFGKLPFRKRAKQIGLGYTQFRNYVDMGRHWIAGRLCATRA